MTNLGDSLKDDKGRKHTGIGVTKILTSSGKKGMQGYSMSTLPLEVMNVPGRTVPGSDQAKGEMARLKKALREKDTALEALKAKLEDEKKTAYQSGLEKGTSDGLEQGESKARQQYDQSLAELGTRVDELIQNLSEEKSRLFLGFEQEALILIMSCVRKVFGEIADTHNEAILPVIKQALDAMAKAQSITVKVNPRDYKTVDESKQEWLPLSQKAEGVVIETDERIEKASCLIDSESTSVEMKLSEITAAMEQALEAVFRKKADGLNQEHKG